MGLAITGKVTGRMLAGAMLRAQAVTPGGLSQKQAAGVGFLLQHFNSNSAAMGSWQKATRLSPEQVVARASLNSGWLGEAGKLIEATTDPIIRAGLLGQIIAPNLQMPPVARLFGDEIGNPAQKPQEIRIKVEEISHLLELKFPEIGLEMCRIPAGEFPMGSSLKENEKFEDGQQHTVKLLGFLIGKYEATNAQYDIYMQQTGVSQPIYWDDPRFGKGKPSHPVVGVNWYEAMAFAKWLGMRLPTEAEGEYAARSTDGRIYPWGNELKIDRVTFNTDGTRPVNAHLEGASSFEVMDLSGNVWEWRFDWYAENYNPADLINPQGPKNGTSKILRGGSWFNLNLTRLRGSYRRGAHPENRLSFDGFRVAEDLK